MTSTRFVLILLSCLTAFSLCNAQSSRTDSLLAVLKNEIDTQPQYTAQKLRRIEETQRRLTKVNKEDLNLQFQIYNELYDEYKTFVNDSAFKYSQYLIQTSRKLKDENKIGYAYVKFGFILLSAGLFKEAFDTLKAVRNHDLPDSSQVDYFRLTARAYADLMVYNNHDYFRSAYNNYYRQYMDSAILHSKPRSYNYYYITIVKALHENNFQKVIETGEILIKEHKLTYPQYAIYYYDQAEARLKLGQEEEGLQNLILSSISDLRGGVRETAAMYTLARLLHKRGDSPNAYIFIKQALKDAEFYGARQRQVEINSILPVIAADRLNTIDEQRKKWAIYSAGITLMVIMTVIFSIIIYKQLKKLRAAESLIKQANQNLQDFNHKLIEADTIKEEYIAYYFNMTTDYVNKIDALRKQTMNLLVNDKKKEALTLLGRFNPQDERAKFVSDFDRVFLRLFPDFVEQFNQLIDPNDPIRPEYDGELNGDLRIFALIRLGIQDNKKISEILNFSINTVYAYKTRVKSKSIVADEIFMKKVMEIKSVNNAL